MADSASDESPHESKVPLRLTKLGHSAVLVESSRRRSPLLLDPGSLTPPLRAFADLAAILITHSHLDHGDPDQVRRARGSGDAPVYGGRETIHVLLNGGVANSIELEVGRTHIDDWAVRVEEAHHEPIYRGVSVPPNLTFRIEERLFAPGDSLVLPDAPVDTLLLPIAGPWMKLADAIDYLCEVQPRLAVPIHDGGLSQAHRTLHCELIERNAPARTQVVHLGLGETIDIDADRS